MNNESSSSSSNMTSIDRLYHIYIIYITIPWNNNDKEHSYNLLNEMKLNDDM